MAHALKEDLDVLLRKISERFQGGIYDRISLKTKIHLTWKRRWNIRAII
jgi:hypothetical protein